MATHNCSTAIVIGVHPLVRLAITNCLERYKITCLKEFDSKIKPEYILNTYLNPDIIFIDIDSTQMNLFYLIEELREMGYSGIIIIISSKNEHYYSKRCALVGANAFLRKEHLLDNIDFALSAVNIGYSFFPFYFYNNFECNHDIYNLELLSIQEMRVMHFLISGFNNKMISQEMKISHKTVSTYKARLMNKLKCTSIVELIIFAKDNNIA
jgi:Response regulator containing a CheY-like receiver domain and an HTH DNA-binding domain